MWQVWQCGSVASVAEQNQALSPYTEINLPPTVLTSESATPAKPQSVAQGVATSSLKNKEKTGLPYCHTCHTRFYISQTNRAYTVHESGMTQHDLLKLMLQIDLDIQGLTGLELENVQHKLKISKSALLNARANLFKQGFLQDSLKPSNMAIKLSIKAPIETIGEESESCAY